MAFDIVHCNNIFRNTSIKLLVFPATSYFWLNFGQYKKIYLKLSIYIKLYVKHIGVSFILLLFSVFLPV